jgi:hypothetical protein
LITECEEYYPELLEGVPDWQVSQGGLHCPPSPAILTLFNGTHHHEPIHW